MNFIDLLYAIETKFRYHNSATFYEHSLINCSAVILFTVILYMLKKDSLHELLSSSSAFAAMYLL